MLTLPDFSRDCSLVSEGFQLPTCFDTYSVLELHFSVQLLCLSVSLAHLVALFTIVTCISSCLLHRAFVGGVVKVVYLMRRLDSLVPRSMAADNLLL